MKQVVSHLKGNGLSVKTTNSIDFGIKEVWIEKGNLGNAKDLLRSIGVTVGVTVRW